MTCGFRPKQPRSRRGPGTRVGWSMVARQGSHRLLLDYGGQRGGAGPGAAPMARLLPEPHHRTQWNHPQLQWVPLSLQRNCS